MRIKRYSIVILFLFVSLYIKATGQSCDVIYINGEQWWLMARPIDKDSALYTRLRDFLPENHCMSTANWDGYTAFWKIEDSCLYLQRMEICVGNYIPVYTSLPITITNNHKLYKYYICQVKSSLGIWIEKPGGCSSRWESPFMFTLARCRSSVSFNDGYTTIALCTWVRMHRYNLFSLFCFSHNF